MFAKSISCSTFFVTKFAADIGYSVNNLLLLKPKIVPFGTLPILLGSSITMFAAIMSSFEMTVISTALGRKCTVHLMSFLDRYSVLLEQVYPTPSTLSVTITLKDVKNSVRLATWISS